MDAKNTKAISPDSTSLSKFGLNNGDLIYLQNPNVEVVTVEKKKTDVKEDPKLKCNHSTSETCVNCIDKIRKMQEEKKVIEKVDPNKDIQVKWDSLVSEKDKQRNKEKELKQKKEEEEKAKKHVPSEREKAGLTPKCTHAIGQKCLHCMETPVVGSNIIKIIIILKRR